MESVRILGEIKKVVQQIDAAAEVFLFGSRVRNEAKEDSDWDIMILTNLPVNLKTEQRFRHELFLLELACEIAISTVVFCKNDWYASDAKTPLAASIKKESVLL